MCALLSLGIGLYRRDWRALVSALCADHSAALPLAGKRGERGKQIERVERVSLLPANMQPAVQLIGLSRHFGEVRAVDNVDLEVTEGEFFALLGPSGSGKTTCLRLIAGFERADAGELKIFGTNIESTPPYQRNVNTVFQDYALFPHLSVLDNVAYGLKIRGIRKQERHDSANEMLNMVCLPDYGARRPAELSGGQRQRVALARALINKPKVLLLDEPLGALDLKLREQMQEELKELQRDLGITFVFVTHDQGEALSLADRVAVFNDGRIMQIGTPQDIYERPNSRFVADFVGSSNVIPPERVTQFNRASQWASLRPERIKLVAQGGYEATVKGITYLGGTTRITLDMQGLTLDCRLASSDKLPERGATVRLDWDEDALHLMGNT